MNDLEFLRGEYMALKSMDSWLLPFLSAVRKRPGMYMGDERVRTLATYLRGYVEARQDLGLPGFSEEETGLMEEFERWLAVKLKSKRTLGFAGHIDLMDGSEKNVRVFFAEFERFLSERGLALTDELAARWPPVVPASKNWSPPEF
ncbi:hypothetical protein [Pyxidicoccus xibeiensis]|uniref:hypothetical protein n=1 Tax=Pyxidicoccus xibeiensis TaxID=2906759 RepID=UPI0020A83335|nr:hypothetical protein [Pyxidicoccus xibeiensis]MCP3138969.1 hypothetical protein [Pyxidicoccus xibeiensis]